MSRYFLKSCTHRYHLTSKGERGGRKGTYLGTVRDELDAWLCEPCVSLSMQNSSINTIGKRRKNREEEKGGKTAPC